MVKPWIKMFTMNTNIANDRKMKIKKFYMAALATAVLAGCSNDDEVAPTMPDMTDTPISVNASVNNLVVSRAGYETNDDLTEFVFNITQSNSNYNWSGVVMKKTGDAWSANNLSAGGNLLWSSSTPNATVTAYTTDTENNTITATNADFTGQAIDVNLPTDQSTANAVKKADYLYCFKEGVTPEAGGILNLDFSHVMSKLEITYSYGTELEGTTTSLTSCTIGELAYKGNFKVETGGKLTVTPSTDADNSASMTANLGTAGKAEVILLPQTVTTTPTATFKVTIDGTERTFTCSVNVNALQSNTRYTMNVTIGRDKVVVGDVDITPWGAPSDLGKIETE